LARLCVPVSSAYAESSELQIGLSLGLHGQLCRFIIVCREPHTAADRHSNFKAFEIN